MSLDSDGQPPRIVSLPPVCGGESGQEAVELAAMAGLHLDPWQQFALRLALGERPGGRWSAFEVGLLVARQNGKGSILEARELAGLFLFDEQLIVHTAHEFKTSADAFRRVSELIQAVPDFDRQVARISGAHGAEGIELKSGQRLNFIARTGGSGRGFPTDTVILDEAYNLTDAAMRALLPTLTTSVNPQIWYTSTAVDKETQPNGHVLTSVRNRALAGDDPSLCYLEWSVDPDVYEADPEGVAHDPEFIRQANPAYGTARLTPEYVENERRALSRRSGAGFAVERLSIGNWPAEEEGDRVIPDEVWADLADAEAVPSGPFGFAVDVPPKRMSASVAAAGRLRDGRLFVETVPERTRFEQRGTSWVGPRCVELAERWRPANGKPTDVPFVIDRTSPAKSLVAPLEDLGLTVYTVDGGQFAEACGGFYDDVMDSRLVHSGQLSVARALAAAQQRKLLDRWVWSRQGSVSISPLIAVTLARYCLLTYGKKKTPPAKPLVEHMVTGTVPRPSDDLATVSF